LNKMALAGRLPQLDDLGVARSTLRLWAGTLTRSGVDLHISSIEPALFNSREKVPSSRPSTPPGSSPGKSKTGGGSPTARVDDP